ncbi:hypothetical protein H6P81_003373 [Aristolochia fimbriata]|uniref:Uncharacterized protein n=1 Tax=Aristolochia fimbriata TaxID=158543 RepID=A0AAV7FCE1_ARIFI|nr:hypothetical protein H6P81_003373 [Aristolochia fimbriata]
MNAEICLHGLSDDDEPERMNTASTCLNLCVTAEHIEDDTTERAESCCEFQEFKEDEGEKIMEEKEEDEKEKEGDGVEKEEKPLEEHKKHPTLSSPEASKAPHEEVSLPEAIVQTDLFVVASPESTEVVETHAATSLIEPEVVEVAPVLSLVEILEVTLVTQEEVTPAVQEATVPKMVAQEVVREEALVVQEEASVVEEGAPVVEEQTPIVQETASLPLPAPPASTPLAIPSQQLVSHFDGVVLQIWKDQIVTRMLSQDAARDASLAADA